MTTREMVTYINRSTGFPRQTVLEEMDKAHKFIFSRPFYNRLYVDPSTGRAPLFATTALKQEYKFPAGSFLDADGNDHAVQRVMLIASDRLPRLYSGTNYFFRWRRYYFQNRQLWRVPGKSYPKTLRDDARIIFQSDPGDSTDVYMLLFNEPVQALTSETIEIELEEGLHIDFQDAVIDLIRKEKYGEKSPWDYFRKTAVKDIWDQLNEGAQGSMGQTSVREEYQEYGVFYQYI